MKIVFLGANDWANTSNRICRGINRAGGRLNARCITENAHRLGYEEDVVIGQDDAGLSAARDAVDGADWIVSSGDGRYDAFEGLLSLLGVNRKKVRLATRHAGSRYRKLAKFLDAEDGEWGFECRLFAPDLYRFAMDDPDARPFIQPQDRIVEALSPVEGPVRISHSPTDREKKGTSVILRGLRPWLKWGRRAVVDVIEGTGFDECHARRACCHALVDQLKPDIGGFGASALEALAGGLVVLSDTSMVVPEVDKWFQRPPIIHVHNASALRRELRRLISHPEHLAAEREQSLAWAKQYLTPAFAYAYYTDCFK